MSEADVVIEDQGAARVLRLNRPQARNASSVVERRSLSEGIVAAGGDIEEFMSAGAAEIMTAEMQRIGLPISNRSKPIIAPVEGLAFGGVKAASGSGTAACAFRGTQRRLLSPPDR